MGILLASILFISGCSQEFLSDEDESIGIEEVIRFEYSPKELTFEIDMKIRDKLYRMEEELQYEGIKFINTGYNKNDRSESVGLCFEESGIVQYKDNDWEESLKPKEEKYIYLRPSITLISDSINRYEDDGITSTEKTGFVLYGDNKDYLRCDAEYVEPVNIKIIFS